MARVKRGVAAHKKHKKLLKAAEGRRQTKHKLVRPAREAATHALTYAFRDRRKRKSQFRALWIARINAASREAGVIRSQPWLNCSRMTSNFLSETSSASWLATPACSIATLTGRAIPMTTPK